LRDCLPLQWLSRLLIRSTRLKEYRVQWGKRCEMPVMVTSSVLIPGYFKGSPNDCNSRAQAASHMRHFVKCFLCLDVVVCFCYYLLGIDAEFVSMHVVVTLSVAMISQRKYGLEWQRNWIQWSSGPITRFEITRPLDLNTWMQWTIWLVTGRKCIYARKPCTMVRWI